MLASFPRSLEGLLRVYELVDTEYNNNYYTTKIREEVETAHKRECPVLRYELLYRAGRNVYRNLQN